MHMTTEKKISKQFIYIWGSLIIVVFIFLGGLFVGAGQTPVFASESSQRKGVSMTTFWRVWELVHKKYATENVIDGDKLIYGAISGMVEALDDPYSTFLPPKEDKEFRVNLKGRFSGVGMEVAFREGQLVVVAPLKGTPADKAGILPGDIVVEIDGVDTQGMDMDEAISLIRGEKGTTVVLTMFRNSEEIIEISVVRDTIVVPTIKTELRQDGIFVISLYNFGPDATSEFRRGLREFMQSGSQKLILDLRGNPGGFLDSAVEITSWFLPAGKVIVTEDFGNDQEDKDMRSRGNDILGDDVSMMVLVDGGSASASEIVAGALQDHGVAKIVGSKTFGKGSVQELIKITDDTSLKITIARWLTPDGRSISEGGLTPDFEVERTQEDFINDRDPQLDMAVKLLK